MARIFNIYFTHDQKVYNAVVSVRKTPFFSEYTLQNSDESILSQLPTNKIISRGTDHFIFQNTPENSPLMVSILKAVAEHMHATEA